MATGKFCFEGRPDGIRAPVLMVEVDPDRVELALASGELACPGCGGMLGPWGLGAGGWWLRGRGGVQQRFRPRRGRCRACRATHALLPVSGLLRRVAPRGFTVADLAARVHAMGGPTGYTLRQAAYDLRKLLGKNLLVKPGRSRRYQVPPPAARTIAALLALRDQVIGPILAGVRSPRVGRKPAHWTASTATTRPSASAWSPCSTTSASPPAAPRHRQPFVDPGSPSPQGVRMRPRPGGR